MKRPAIAILASGQGTTAEAFIRASATGRVTPSLGLVICNNKQAGIFDRINRLNREFGLNTKTIFINGKTHPEEPGEAVLPGCQTKAEEAAIMQLLTDGNFDAIVLMGYMKRVGQQLVREFGWRPEYTSPYQAKMINTHPGLLPETQGEYGIHCQELVLNKKLGRAGQTLHIVAEDYDDGPILFEHQVPVEPNDTPETLFARVQAAEKEHLPKDIEAFIRARWAYHNGMKE